VAERRLTDLAPRRFRLRRGWLALSVLTLALLVWFGLPSVLRRLDFFRVRRVEIAGLQYLDPTKVMSALRLAPRASVFDDADPLVRRLRAVPGVINAEISYRVPGTLQVEVHEAVPVALTPSGDRLALVDAGGRVLPFDPVGSVPDLPVLIGGGGLVAGALARVQDYNPEFFARVDAAWRVGTDVVLEVAGRWFWFDAQPTAEDIRAVTAVEQALSRRGRPFQELDGRFAGQVIVRWSRA
jgi:cell division septal protein FtsQ